MTNAPAGTRPNGDLEASSLTGDEPSTPVSAMSGESEPVSMPTAGASKTDSLTGPQRFGRWLLLIVGLALIIRLGYVAIAKQQLFSDDPALLWSGDQIYYSGQARWLADGFGFQWRYNSEAGFGTPAADHPPLTAVMMTPASFFEQGFLAPQRYLMAVYGSITVGALGFLGRRIAGARAGLVAAFIAAIYPNFWLNDGVIMSEGPTVLMTILFLLATYRFVDKPTVANAALCGVGVGLAALGRAEMALLLPLVMVPVILRLGQFPLGQRAKLIAVAAGISLLTVAPWVVPNLFRFEEPVLMSTNDGLTIVGTNCEPAYEGGGIGFWHLNCKRAFDAELQGLDQSQRSSFLRQKGFEYMFDNLDRLPTVMVARVGRMWSVYEPSAMERLNAGEGREPNASKLGRFIFYPLVLLAIAGGVLLRRRGQNPLWPLAALPVLVTIVGALFYGIVRFRAPAEISIALLAAVALVEIYQRLDPRRRAASTARAGSTSLPSAAE